LPLDYITAHALEGQAAAISSRKLTVRETSEPGGAWVTGSQALMSRMVENVIENAVCHNTYGGWIRITTGTAGGRASMVVENGGPVLEQDQVRELSQPFRRIGADRTGSDKGSGLGLAIVAAIAEAHGGSLDLHARPEGGLRVSIELPVAAGVPAGVRA
jgi:signal transduction histidine kinase